MSKIYEYRIFIFEPHEVSDNHKLENFLDEIGENGWEVIQVNDESLLAKREKETPNYLNK